MTDDAGSRDILLHYEDRYDEDSRLSESGLGQLELVRTQQILQRHLPRPPASILDVGGGPGVYGAWLTAAGYAVELIDIVPRHVARAAERGLRARLGDARRLPVPDASCDAVLLLGPLYHLTDPVDRARALHEAIRVGRPAAPVFVAAISRFAPALDGLELGFYFESDLADMVRDDLAHGVHTNPTGDPRYFTTAYFHHPDELAAELHDAGLDAIELIPVEGIGWAAPDLDARMANDTHQEMLLELLERLEAEPTLLGASPHLIGVGRVPR
jgi:SAM-dependent methyltransferase